MLPWSIGASYIRFVWSDLTLLLAVVTGFGFASQSVKSVLVSFDAFAHVAAEASKSVLVPFDALVRLAAASWAWPS